jgi:hypothetical protein
LELANKGRIINCDVTQQDILNAEHIFRPDNGSLKGKTVRKASDQVQSGDLVPIPATIMAHYRNVVLCVDVVKVNKMPFLVTISRAIKFGTVVWLKNAKADTILKQITDVHNIYIKRGFLLEIFEVDGQFEPLHGALSEMGVTLNRCSREEYVPVSERRICTLKERCRCICNTLLFKKLPGMLVVQMASTWNFWLNIFAPKDGIYRNINPRELFTGVNIDYNKHIQAEFGEYVQLHEEHDNIIDTRTTGAIATKPTGNAQVGHWFYSFAAGRMLNRRQWIPLPMPSDVIERINVLAKASQAGMNVTNMRNELYDDNDNADSDTDSEYNSDDASSVDENDADDDYDDLIAGVDTDNPGNSNLDAEEAEEANENNNDGLSACQGGDEALYDVSLSEENVNKDVPTNLKKLSDDTGALPPMIQSRTRQQAKETGASLMTGTEKSRLLQKNSVNSGRHYRSDCSRGRKKKTRKSSETN